MVPDMLLLQLSELVGEHLGLHFPKERWPDLERGVWAAAQECGDHDVDGYVQTLLSSRSHCREVEILASHLTVGETYFFREKQSLDVLQQTIIPELIRTRRSGVRQLRIWSAGCATGEEPYSVAILLSRAIPDLANWNLSILATDLNTRSLEKASQGVYGEWSFRNTPMWVRSGYFTTTADGRWAIIPAIKKMVTFGYLNLVADAYPSNLTNAMDVIFCRNVLMYFAPQATRGVVHRFYRCLADGGWLIVSPTETSSVLFSGLATVRHGEATLYRKTSMRQEHTPSPPAPLPQGRKGRRHQEAAARLAEWGEGGTHQEAGVLLTLGGRGQLALDHEGLPWRQMSEIGANPECAPESTDALLTSPSRIQVQTDDGIQDSALPLPVSPAKAAAGERVLSNAVGDRTPAVSYAEALKLCEQGRYEDSEAMTVALLSQSRGDRQAMLLLARLYANQGRLREALECCEKAIAANKVDARAHYLRATILQEQGSQEEAALALRHALYVDPQFALGHFALANLALRQGKLKESEKHFENTLTLLAGYHQEDIVPESGGLTAGRLRDLLSATKLSDKSPLTPGPSPPRGRGEK